MYTVRPGSIDVEPGQPRRGIWIGVNVAISSAVVALSLATAMASALVFLIPGLLCLGLEGLAPGRHQSRSLGAWTTDLTHAIGNRTLIAAGLAVTYHAAHAVIDVVVPSAVPAAVATLPRPMAFLVVFLITDFVNYGFHRLSHEWTPLWRLHRVHHSSSQLDWLATTRGHFADQILAFTAIVIPGLVLGQGAYVGPIIVILFVWPFICHSNVRFRWPWLEPVIVTPRFHHWHHGRGVEAHDRNYGAVLVIWDRWLRTDVKSSGFPDVYGASDLEDRPDYLFHLVSPLR